MTNIQNYIETELAKDQFKTYDSLFWEFFGLEKKPGFLFNFNRQIGYVALVYNFRKVSGAKARGLGNVNDLTIERIQSTMKELEQIEVEQLKKEIEILEAVARQINPKSVVSSKSTEPAKKVIAQKKYKAMVKVSQDSEYVPTTLSETESQIKDLIAQASENVSYNIVHKLVNDGKNVIENFLPEYNKQAQQLKVKIGEREYAYHDIDLSELSVLTLEQWFDLNN